MDLRQTILQMRDGMEKSSAKKCEKLDEVSERLIENITFSITLLGGIIGVSAIAIILALYSIADSINNLVGVLIRLNAIK